MTIDTFRLIAQTQAAYASAIDNDRLEEWPDFFADPCMYVITTADNHREGLEAGLVFANSHGMLKDRISALREANIYESQRYRHAIGTPLIEPGEDGLVLAQSNFFVVRIMHTGESMLFASGRYRDRIIVSTPDSVPQFKERSVILDSRQLDTLLAIPI